MTTLEMEFDGVLAIWLGPEETNYADGVWVCAECYEALAFGHADDCEALAAESRSDGPHTIGYVGAEEEA